MAEAAVASPQPETSAGPATTAAAGAGADCSPSPPPNCAICLGNCINKCFSDSCMHQFCFKCLLEWSKVKAVCPLCKQPFQSIIHNVKSIDEYDQHFIPQTTATEAETFEDVVWRDTSRHFQFRTTLTVDPRGELAIQHLLSTHSMTNSLSQYTRMNVIPPVRDFYQPHRNRDMSPSQYRRQLYEHNLYTHPMPDITGRYRETSPSFYSVYPGSKNRLVPFLQRELSALLPDESRVRTMNLVRRILVAIEDHPIRGRYMKTLLRPEIGAHTDHFLYEFYTFARSPYDLYGYDRHSEVLAGGAPAAFTEDTSDSDVLIVSVMRPPARVASEVIEIGSESSHDSDVVIHEAAPPVTVDLANTTSSSSSSSSAAEELPPVATAAAATPAVDAAPKYDTHLRSYLPFKLRHKHGRHARKKRCTHDTQSSSSDCETMTTSSSEDERERPRKRAVTLKVREYHSSQTEECSSSEEVDNRVKRKRLRKKKHPRKYVASQKRHAELAQPHLLPMPRPTYIKNELGQPLPPAEPLQAQPVASHADGACPNNFYPNPGWYSAYAAGAHSGEPYDPSKYAVMRFPDEPGPSGICSNAAPAAQAWQPKQCSDSD